MIIDGPANHNTAAKAGNFIAASGKRKGDKYELL